MDVASLKSKLKANQLPSYLIFAGSEWKVQQIYVKQMVKVTNKSLVYIDSISDIYSQLKNKSFIQTANIYVVRDDKELLQNEKIQQQITSGLLGDNILVHLLTAVDKRTKFYKQYKDDVIEFEQLSDDILKKYIKKEVDLSERNCDILIDVCEHDYGHILLEIDKIKKYQSVYQDDGNHSFEVLLADGTIHQPPYDAIFDLVDAILDRKVKKTFDLLQQSYEVGEATMVMLSVLYNNAKAVLQLQTCNSDNISKSTGLTGWQIKNAKPHMNKYTIDELIFMLRLIHRVESGIKSGKMEDEFAMQYLLVRIM